ncbi:group II intron reverse transcriptase/maturase [Saccharothrix sp. ALI-22-I]|uniref:group II intron reverse transcriptase/maturase n=1 Tax=Saccharothrix sp. ALI-22-I TaxID=1933778 RepID=UPI00097BD503|nr:group II intron reverse transcriptase/maturase [Saccharothrix sp. ALI-22-I]ONI88148.1 group II intron reverse transcriptase/maturase [Saccharothrix sp. ALI-22-I]
MDQLKASGKPFDISKTEVWSAWLKVKGNQGASGVDGQSIEEFEKDLRGNLYRIWNRMSSGTYFPPPVRAVEIDKPYGAGTRILGVPTVADRVAQTVVAAHLETRVEPVFHPDSYGYRSNRSALDAVEVCRKRCWKFDWVVDLDIRKFFDSVPWDLVVRAVEAHTDARWVVLYVKRWLAASVQQPDGTLLERKRGTPQGSSVSPVLANLFMHYAFDRWLAREFPAVPFERYADDAVVHCTSLAQARKVLAALRERMAEVGLELHPDKTRIVYCKDSNRPGEFEHRSFTFLGFTFRPRRARRRDGVQFTGFLPAVSSDALKKMGAQVRSWRLHRRTGSSEADLAGMINPVVRGWMAYYGAFHRSELYPVLHRINAYLLRWLRNKYRRLRPWKKALAAMSAARVIRPRYFARWAWAPPIA